MEHEKTNERAETGESNRSALVQIMACRLFDAKSLSEPILGYCQFDPRNKLHWNFHQNSNILLKTMLLKTSPAIFPPNGRGGRWVKRYDCELNILLFYLEQCLCRGTWSALVKVMALRQAITWTNDYILTAWPLGTHFIWFLTKIRRF